MPKPLHNQPGKPSPHTPNKPTDRGYLGADAISLLLYGPPGIGKTSFASCFPGVGFVCDPRENSIHRLVQFRQAKAPVFIFEAPTWEHIIERLSLEFRQRMCQTLVFDSLLGIERLMHLSHCHDAYNNDWTERGFYNFNKGPKTAVTRVWEPFLDLLEGLRANGTNIVILAHQQQKPYNNPLGSDYDEILPSCDKATLLSTNRWVDLIALYRMEASLDGKGVKKKIVLGQESRILYLEPTSGMVAKNRFGLPPSLVLEDSYQSAYNIFESAFRKLVQHG